MSSAPGSGLGSGLAERWPLAGLSDVRDSLLLAWGSPGRGYHDPLHLTEVLDRLELLDCSEVSVLLAAWFHDAVYDGAPDDVARSASWASRSLPSPLGAEVARLVLITADHRPAADDLAGQLLCDADLGILAADPERYDEYVRGVRREYAHVDDALFAAGRAAILEDLLAREHLFWSPVARALWEAPARANLAREIATLRTDLG